MGAILQPPFSNEFSLTFVSRGTISNNSALVQNMAWSRTGDKPLSEQNMAPDTEAFMRHSVPIS